MDKLQMLKLIYEVIANKDISPWCKVYDIDDPVEIFEVADRGDVMIKRGARNNHYYNVVQNPFGKYVCVHIIWHPVMIGDVLDWLWQNWYFYFCHHKKHVQFKWFKPIFSCEWIRSEDQKKSWWHGTNIYCKCNDYKVTLWDMREEKRKPIEDQSDECITFIYNLLPQWS